MEDKTIKCQDCGADFIWTVGEQEFYKEKGLQSEPKRCPSCRKAKRNKPGKFNGNFNKSNDSRPNHYDN